MKKIRDYMRYGEPAAAIAAGVTDTNVFTEVAPANLAIVITHCMTYADQPAAFGNMVWKFKRNGIAIFPYDYQKTQIGSVDLIPIETIIINPGETFTVDSDNLNTDGAGLSYIPGVIFRGYYAKP